jgi:tRNA U34 5-methylaminomethyl-2-thiouridine-forming methyltransferase MnmC
MLTTRNFKGKLGEYHLIDTEDGSQALYSEYFDENTHSLSGTQKETQHVYLGGCKILNKFQSNNSLNILEIGFGAGVGALETYKLYKSLGINTQIEFLSTELDSALVDWATKYYDTKLFNNLKLDSSKKFYKSKIGNFTLKILIGDCKQTLAFRKINFIDAIYQDAFSPKKNSDLWTEEWFRLLKDLSSAGVIMSTYSCSKQVRKAMHAAGWNVEQREGFGRKRFITIADLSLQRKS